MFQDLKLSIKIGLGFALILILLSLVLGLSVIALNKADDGIEEYQSQTRTLILSGHLQADMLMANMKIKDYLITNSEADYQQYEAISNELRTSLNATQKQVSKPERIEYIKQIDNSITRYHATFTEVVSLTKQKNELARTILIPKGQVMQQSISAIINQSYLEQNTQAAYLGAQVLERLLLGRLNVLAFLQSSQQKDYDVAIQYLRQDLRDAVSDLDVSLEGDENRNQLENFYDAYGEFVDALNAMHTIVESRANIIDTNLSTEQQEVEGSLEQMSNSIIRDQEILGPQLKESTNNSITLTLILSSAAILFGTLAAYLLTVSITRPLQEAMNAANKLAQGDLTANVKQKGKDEVGQLLGSIQGTADNLRNMISTISNASTDLTSASQELSSITEKTSKGIQQQETETDMVATAMNEMTATVNEVASSASQAEETAQLANQQAISGSSIVQQAIETINQLADNVLNSSDKLHEVEVETNNIGGILDVIRGITDQTNLLALNAAIEAARAGEHGRGFAVVADEVRSLALRTQESTQEIQTLIEQLQNGTNAAVSVMAASREQANVSVTHASEAGTALESITHAIGVINDMNMQIATASEQQSSVAESINENVINVKQIANDNSHGAEQTQDSSNEIARLAQQMKHLVDQFRV